MAYVYRHIRVDKNEPFYIGIGSAPYYKRAKTKRGRNPLWLKITAKTEYEVEILFDNVDLDFAKEKEKEFIKLYGRIDNGDGTLANLSAGGDGMFDVSAGVRKRLSELNRGENNSFFGKKHTAETRLKISQMQIGTTRGPLAEETRRKIGIANKGNTPPLKGKKDPKGGAARTGIGHHRWKGSVMCYTISGEFVKEFSCNMEAAKYFGVANPNFVRRVIVGERNSWKEHIFKTKTA